MVDNYSAESQQAFVQINVTDGGSGGGGSSQASTASMCTRPVASSTLSPQFRYRVTSPDQSTTVVTLQTNQMESGTHELSIIPNVGSFNSSCGGMYCDQLFMLRKVVRASILVKSEIRYTLQEIIFLPVLVGAVPVLIKSVILFVQTSILLISLLRTLFKCYQYFP